MKNDLIVWAQVRIHELWNYYDNDSIIERVDLMGATMRYNRMIDNPYRTSDKVLENCLGRISSWKGNREENLSRIKSKPKLVSMFLHIGK